MWPLASKLAEDTKQNVYNASGKRISAPIYDVENLILPIRKYSYAPDVELSDLIHDEAVFQALTGIDWTTINFQPLGGEMEDEPAQEDPQPSHQPEAES